MAKVKKSDLRKCACEKMNIQEELPDGVRISYVISQIPVEEFVRKIKNETYSHNLESHFHYDVEFMLRLILYLVLQNIPCRKARFVLTEEDLLNLYSKSDREKYCRGEYVPFPSSSTINYFALHRISDEILDAMQKKLSSRILFYMRQENDMRNGAIAQPNNESFDGIATIDGSPVIGALHSAVCAYNDHYKGNIDKFHCLQLNGIPLFFLYSEGNEGDNQYAEPLLIMAKEIGLRPECVIMDKGYDSFETYANVYGLLGTKPIIHPKDNAVIHKEGTIEGIDDFIVNYWEEGGDKHWSNNKKLQFIFNLKQKELSKPESERRKTIIQKCNECVGTYFRNQLIENPSYLNEMSNKRKICESRHNHIKRIAKIMAFNVRKKSKALYAKMKFVVYLMLKLFNLQNGIQNNNFARYI